MLSEYDKYVKGCAKKLRHNLTPEEKQIKSFLCKSRIPFKKQRVIKTPNGSYIVDFLLFARVVLEVDGEYHNTDDQKVRDKARTIDIENQGYRVIRIKNEDTKTAESIEKHLKEGFYTIGIDPSLFFPIPQ